MAYLPSYILFYPIESGSAVKNCHRVRAYRAQSPLHQQKRGEWELGAW
jgi:hypothetical protein